MLNLKNSKLLQTNAYVAGQWVAADSGQTFAVTNPANGQIITHVADMGAAETKRAIEAAAKAYPAWAAKTAKERATILRKWNDLMLANADDLAIIMTAEQGKPLAESKGEVAYGAAYVEWFAEEGKRAYGEIVPEPAPNRRILVTKEPVGVVAAITPWNFPNAMIARKVAPALAAGCAIVVKPGEDTPLSALAMAYLAEEAGLPAGLFSVLPTHTAANVGSEMTSNPLVRKLSFTGSTAVGKILTAQCAQTVKKVSMELGGNAPFIVFDDADLDAAVLGAMASKFRNTGQTCVCANRILVQAGVYDAFAAKLTEAVKKMVVGPGLEGVTQQGPLINKKALDKVKSHVDDAINKGAVVQTGGKPHKLGGTFFEPTVLTEMTPNMRLFREETFGPVAGLFRFETEEQAIQMANDTEFGLASYFYSKDLARCFRVARALEYGIVGVNEGLISTEVAPFGGVKESGVGREGHHLGLDEYLEVKYVCLGGLT